MSWMTHKVDNGERAYESERARYLAQYGDQNSPSFMGIQTPDPKYGAVNPEAEKDESFAQPDAAGNIASTALSTGNAEVGVSGTTNPSDAQDFASQKVMETMQKIATGENRNYNNPEEIYG
tara:strand:+ start:23693 stop:24055 length:363 start_codon:yes stop_codon:yes gene_type:complete